MRCHEAQQRLNNQSLRDPGATCEEAVLDHLRNCTRCAALAKAQNLIAEDLELISSAAKTEPLSFDSLRSGVDVKNREQRGQSREIQIMSKIAESIKRRPRVGLSVIAVAAIVIAAIIIPFQFEDEFGYELAVAGVDQEMISSGAISELLSAVGLPDAIVDIQECNPKCVVVVSGLKTAEEAQTAAALFRSLPDLHVRSKDSYTDKQTGKLITRSTSKTTVADGRWTIEHGVDSLIDAKVTIILDSLTENSPVTWTQWFHSDADSTEMRNEVERLPNGGYKQTLHNPPIARLGWTKTSWTFDSTDHATAYTVTDSFGVDHDIDFQNWAKMEKQLEKVGWFYMITYDDTGTPYVTTTNCNPSDQGLETTSLASGMYLNQNEPNPFDTLTMIVFGLPETAHVKLTIYNHNSEPVRTLVDGVMAAGGHKIMYDARNEEGKRVWSWRQICKIEIGEYYHSISMAQVR